MKAVTVKELKEELTNYTPKELRDLCLRLARFKKENKELLTYLLFESSDERLYIENIKNDVDEQFEQINKKSPYLIKKSFRKILRTLRKYSRYSLKKETEVELLIYFCRKLKKFTPPISRNNGLQNLYNKQIDVIVKKIILLHEDLQFDYRNELNSLNDLQ
jgi:Glu-tRNA(Gln) amidotransferase subunit E-like FAD-binding protein